MYVTSHSQLCLNMYHLVFSCLEQFVKFVDWMGFQGFLIVFRLKWWSSSFSKNKLRFDCSVQFLHNNGIADRDLKPANILWSNKRGNITDTAELNIWPWKNYPLQCKLTALGINRSSRPEVFCKKGFLKNWAEACNFIKKETLAQVFSYEFYEIFQNTFFDRTSLVAVSQSRSLICEELFEWHEPNIYNLVCCFLWQQSSFLENILLDKQSKKIYRITVLFDSCFSFFILSPWLY